jgi:hypothetical protein
MIVKMNVQPDLYCITILLLFSVVMTDSISMYIDLWKHIK